MKWDLHIYDPKTQTTKTHVRDYPGTVSYTHLTLPTTPYV